VPLVPQAQASIARLAGAKPIFHGGGWLGGSLQSHDVLCRASANAGGLHRDDAGMVHRLRTSGAATRVKSA
jgi:hypothetical protein